MTKTLTEADNRAEFETLVEPCKQRLWTFLLRLVQNREQAEDLFQETLLRAWRGLPKYRDRGQSLSWLFRIAHNVVRDDWRRQARRPQLVMPDELPDVADAGRADDRLTARERQGRVSRGLRSLTFEQRQVFLLRVHTDMTFGAVAELIGAPLSTVINRMRDALAKLTEAVEDN